MKVRDIGRMVSTNAGIRPFSMNERAGGGGRTNIVSIDN